MSHECDWGGCEKADICDGHLNDLKAALATAESERDQARKELMEAQKQMGIWRELYKSCGQYRDENKCAEAEAAEQQVRSLEEQVQAKDAKIMDAIRLLDDGWKPETRKMLLAALSPRRES